MTDNGVSVFFFIQVNYDVIALEWPKELDLQPRIGIFVHYPGLSLNGSDFPIQAILSARVHDFDISVRFQRIVGGRSNTVFLERMIDSGDLIPESQIAAEIHYRNLGQGWVLIAISACEERNE
jgi:hypothetical protein